MSAARRSIKSGEVLGDHGRCRRGRRGRDHRGRCHLAPDARRRRRGCNSMSDPGRLLLERADEPQNEARREIADWARSRRSRCRSSRARAAARTSTSTSTSASRRCRSTIRRWAKSTTSRVNVTGADKSSLVISNCPTTNTVAPFESGTFEYSSFASLWHDQLRARHRAWGLVERPECQSGKGTLSIKVTDATTIDAATSSSPDKVGPQASCNPNVTPRHRRRRRPVTSAPRRTAQGASS